MFIPWDNKDKLLTRWSSEASGPCLPLPINRSCFLSPQKCLCHKPEPVGEAGGAWGKSTEIREINIYLWEWKNWRSNRHFSIQMHAASLEFISRDSWELASRRQSELLELPSLKRNSFEDRQHGSAANSHVAGHTQPNHRAVSPSLGSIVHLPTEMLKPAPQLKWGGECIK